MHGRRQEAVAPAILVGNGAQAVGIAQAHTDGLSVDGEGEIAAQQRGDQAAHGRRHQITRHNGPYVAGMGTGITGGQHAEDDAEGDAVDGGTDEVIDADNEDEDLEYRVVAIVRGSKTIIPTADDRFEEEDMVYAISRNSATHRVVELSGRREVEIRNMMILGGSRIGVRIANELQNDINIKLVDYNADKAFHLAERLDKTLIINEDGRDTEAMMEEDLAGMDAFVAVTGRSETNILAAMLAKRMGVKKVIAEVENINYISLAESIGVDTIINKKLVTASNIFRFTMTSEVQAIKCLTGSQAEVMEFIVKPNSPATKHKIRDLGLPDDSIIGGVVRGDRVFIAVDDTQINAYDRVVVFAMPEAVMRVAEFFN